MAPDVEAIIREALTSALQDEHTKSSDQSGKNGSNGGGLSGIKGLAAGVGAAALAPVAVKTAGKLARGLGMDGLDDLKSPKEALEGAKSHLTDRLTSGVKDKAKDAVDEAGGPGGIVKDAAKGMLPFGGGDGGGGKGGVEGVGKGRRMPVQQSVDIGIPIEAVYNQFTQFEDWPQFMHRVKRVTQDDDCTVSFAVKIWGRTKEFTANIETQRPDQRIKWKTSQGMTHAGVVTFHELGPNLTRVILNLDVDPGSLIEKFARGARHVKRAARAELHRFVAFIEMAEHETGAWRGVIEDGEVVEDHDPGYDEQREYSDIEELTAQSDEDQDEDEDERGDDEDEDAQETAQSDEDQDEGEDDRGGDEDEDAQESPKAPTSRSQRARGSGRQGRDTERQSSRGRQASSSGNRSASRSGRSSSASAGRSQSRSGSSRRQSSDDGGSGSSGRSQGRSRSSRQSSSGGSASSRSSRSRASSGGQSRSGSRSQSRRS